MTEAAQQIQQDQPVVKVANRLGMAIATPKRIKIIVGGRGSTKSTGVADYVLDRVSRGGIWCCGREFLNSIDESVHRLMLDEIDRLTLGGYWSDRKHIFHASGGRTFYRGLNRNPTSLKSMLTGVDGLWIEEGETLSDETLRIMTASLRLSAEDVERKLAGEEIKMPEIWITMNRGLSTDPVSRKLLKRAEKDLAKYGWYEDDALLVVQINYTDIPNEWFVASGLEVERADDEKNMSQSEYSHKWHGAYYDTVENAIIPPDWFDACVDAHIKLGIEPRGVEVITHDPSDGGDGQGISYRHGIVFKEVFEIENTDVNAGADMAVDYCVNKRPDAFLWDSGGLGLTLRRQYNDELGPKNINVQMFDGASGVVNPDQFYEDGKDFAKDKKTNKQAFKNKRAQFYIYLRDRMWRTYRAVTRGEYIDPDTLISFDSEGIGDNLGLLRAQICSIPKKYNPIILQIMNKKEMKTTYDLDSPNMADCVMMSLAYNPEKVEIIQPIRRRPRKF